MENTEAIWTTRIFKIRSRVKMEMCLCNDCLCIISSICVQIFEVLHHFIFIFLPGYTQFMVKAAWVQSDRDDPMIFSGFEISNSGISFW